jgi:hypothetical protein
MKSSIINLPNLFFERANDGGTCDTTNLFLMAYYNHSGAYRLVGYCHNFRKAKLVLTAHFLRHTEQYFWR